MPPERERQFDLIAIASANTLQWARETGIALERIEPVVPFVETDFGLAAWLFLDTEERILLYRSNGTDHTISTQFRSQLASAGYPAEWLNLVSFYFGSKERVDLEYQGSYFNFLR